MLPRSSCTLFGFSLRATESPSAQPVKTTEKLPLSASLGLAGEKSCIAQLFEPAETMEKSFSETPFVDSPKFAVKVRFVDLFGDAGEVIVTVDRDLSTEVCALVA